MRVLVEPAVADLGKAKDALDDEERVLDFGPDLRFGFRPSLGQILRQVA